jgi:hypothetical protein
MVNTVKLLFQAFIGVNGKIGGDKRKSGAVFNMLFKKITNLATGTVIDYSGTGHGYLTE